MTLKAPIAVFEFLAANTILFACVRDIFLLIQELSQHPRREFLPLFSDRLLYL